MNTFPQVRSWVASIVLYSLTVAGICLPSGCSSDSRDDFRADSSPATNPGSPPVPPVMVGQKYAINTMATKEQPARKYTGVVKSVNGSDVVLAAPVSEMAISSKDDAASDDEKNHEPKSRNEEITIKGGTIAQLEMLFTSGQQ